MKTYTFKLPKNNNSADIYKEKLMKRVINAYPWLTVESLLMFYLAFRNAIPHQRC